MLSKTTLAIVGVVLFAGLNVTHAATTGKPTQTVANPYDCVTDDGYGRKRPCSANFKQKQAEPNPNECLTDDGYGRKRPCSASIKR